MHRRLLHVTSAVPLRLLCQPRRSLQSMLLRGRLRWVMHSGRLGCVLRMLMRLLLMLRLLLTSMRLLMRRSVRHGGR